MTTAAQTFSQIGRALFGDHYKAPMAAALDVSVDRVDDWGKGRGNPPPAGVWRDLVQILDDRLAGLPRLRTAAMAVANATGLKVTVVSLDGLHVVVDPNNPSAGVLHKGSLASCDQFVAQETEKAFRSAAIVTAGSISALAERLAREAHELSQERARRRLSAPPFDDKNFQGVLSLAFAAIGTGDRQVMVSALGTLESLRLRMPPAGHINEVTRAPARDLVGNPPTGQPERIR